MTERPPESMEPDVAVAEPGAATEPISDRRRRWLKIAARIRRWFRRFGWSVATALFLIVVAVLLVAQTSRGQELAVGAALDQVRGRLAGELQVVGVRSGTLLTGATLTEVRLSAADGRPFLSADSLVVRYSLLSTVFGSSPIRSTTIWGLDLEISRYTDDQPMNVTRLIAEGSPDSLRTTADQPFSLGQIGIREGTVRILAPATPGSPAPTAEGPNGEELRVLRFDALDLDLETAVLAPSSAVTFEAQLASFSSEISILEDPLVIEEAFGVVTLGAQGVRVRDAAFRLPGSLLRGQVTVGPQRADDPWIFRTDLESDGWADLADVFWVDDRIPEGRFRGAAAIASRDELIVDMDRLEVELEASQVVFGGRVRFGDVMSLDAVDVTASPITLERLEPWLEQEIPFDGWLSGRATFGGTLDNLDAAGRVTLIPTGLGANATTADFTGTVHRGADPGATDFEARLEQLNYTVLEAIFPGLPWGGSGSAMVQLDGRTQEGMQIVADFAHVSDSAFASHIEMQGLLWGGVGDEDWITDLDVELDSLAVGIFSRLAPDLGLQGTVSGPLRVDGPLRALTVRGELAAGLGTLDFEAAFDATDMAAGYVLDVLADSVSLGLLSARLPEVTRWSGRLALDGAGFAIDSMSTSATLVATRSRVGPVRVDTASATMRLERGVLVTDTLNANVGGVDVSGHGRFGLAPGTFGDTRFDFSAPSLVGLRPWMMGVGDTVLVQDGLSELDRDFLRLQGIEPDTLPSEADVRFEGELSGSASLSGELNDVDLGVLVEVFDGRYKQNAVDTIQILFTATQLPATTGAWQMGATGLGIVFEGREFAQGGFEADMFELGGEGRAEVVRRPGEQYRALGSFRLDSFVLDSISGEVDLAEASIQVDEDTWTLARSSLIAWEPGSVRVDSLIVDRVDDDPMHLIVDGTLNRGGDSDFRLGVSGLHLEQLLNLAQRNDLGVGGHLNMDVNVRGPSEAPVIDSRFRIDGPRYGVIELSRIEGSMQYEELSTAFLLDGFDGARVALSSSGAFPLDLALTRVEDRVVEAPIDVRIAADSLDAAIALSYVTTLEEVLGSVSGEVWIQGTPELPEPEGTVTLSDAEWSIEAIGVRHTGVGGELRLRADRTVDVELTARGSAIGSSVVTGTVLLEPFRDPALNLNFSFDRFQAVLRPDIEGLVSGSFDLGGTYRRPVARGAITVDEGAIYVEELQRAAGVVDLSDPFLFEGVLAVDTTALVTQPLFAGLRNPFFDNLRVDVDLSVPRDTWLRSLDTNVELNGDLLVRYDRFAGDFVLIGELQAARGSHRVLGRTFEIDEGTVGFIGRPGMNPDLDIQASTRIRRPNDAPLNVIAQVEGTLVQPVVTLSAEEAGLAEEDLVSYLIFGQPSGSLGVSQGQALGQLGGRSAAATFGQGFVTYVGGAFANQFGSAIAQELSLDYVSIQQGGGVQTAGQTYVGDTQLELGRYVGDNLFVVMVLRPFDTGAQEQNNVAGLRVEWALTDDYNVEGFLEDRFLRSGSTVLGTSGLLENERIWGVFLFRDWGYGSGNDR